MHKAILKDREAFDYLVDCVHKLMALEDWKNAKALNQPRIGALNVPNKEISYYFKAVEIMQGIDSMKQEAEHLYNIVKKYEGMEE